MSYLLIDLSKEFAKVLSLIYVSFCSSIIEAFLDTDFQLVPIGRAELFSLSCDSRDSIQIILGKLRPPWWLWLLD